jgi:hypothetical protein
MNCSYTEITARTQDSNRNRSHHRGTGFTEKCNYSHTEAQSTQSECHDEYLGELTGMHPGGEFPKDSRLSCSVSSVPLW